MALRSDEQRCENEATHANGLFCVFHAKQVFALYKGYKRRNAQLGSMDDDPPEYLSNSEIPLSNDTFETIKDTKILEEVQIYLHHKYVLLNKVIDARKLHHKRFYSLDMDYGHQVSLRPRSIMIPEMVSVPGCMAPKLCSNTKGDETCHIHGSDIDAASPGLGTYALAPIRYCLTQPYRCV